MAEHIERTIADFEQELRTKEEDVLSIKRLINSLRARLGQPSPYPDVETANASASRMLRGDEYLGKTQHIAAKEILLRRKALGIAPVSLDDIYADLVAGGYQFETEDIGNRKRGLSMALSKGSSVFYRVPSNGLWGLLEWYPGVKQPKRRDPTDEDGKSVSKKIVSPADEEAPDAEVGA